MSFERILVATDFSDGSQQALEYALRIAEKFGSELTLVHSWEAPNYAYATDLYMPIDMLARIERAALERLEQATTELKARFPGAKSRLRSGSPWEQILGAATDVKADLIVMGTHGRRGLQRALLGSVAEKGGADVARAGTHRARGERVSGAGARGAKPPTRFHDNASDVRRGTRQMPH